MGAYISSLVFQPPPCSLDEDDYGLDKSYVLVDGTIRSFFFRQPSPIYIIFSHGNAEDINIIHDHLEELSQSLSVNVIGYEYPGYGSMDESICPSEAQCYSAIDTVYRYLTEELTVPSKCILLYGRSLGAGSCCYLAEKCAAASSPVGGVILQSAFTSIFRVTLDFRFSLPGDMFCNVDRLPCLYNTPVWLIHGTNDEIVPFYHAEENFDRIHEDYRCKPLYVLGGGHNDLESLVACGGEGIAGSLFARRFDEFVKEWRINAD
jgi:abhydrolase domain-containing protein 17